MFWTSCWWWLEGALWWCYQVLSLWEQLKCYCLSPPPFDIPHFNYIGGGSYSNWKFWCSTKINTTQPTFALNDSGGHLVHQCLLQTRVWGWGCPWWNSTHQTSPSSSRSCWSGSSPGGRNIEQKNLKSKLPLRWVWSRWPVECQTKIRGGLGRGSNRPLPSGTSPRRGESAARRELKIRFVQIRKCHQSTFVFSLVND